MIEDKSDTTDTADQAESQKEESIADQVTDTVKDVQSHDAERGQTGVLAQIDESGYIEVQDDSTKGDSNISDATADDATPPVTAVETLDAEPSTKFPPEPQLNSGGDAPEHVADFPPEPRLGQRAGVWANGRQYGSITAAAIATGVDESVLRARIASSDESFSTYRWAE